MLEKIKNEHYVFNKKDTNKIVKAMASLYPQKETELAYDNHFQLVVAVVLSAQATDVSVNLATVGLFAAYPTPEKMMQASVEEIAEKIKTIGLYRNKAKFLKSLSTQLVEKHDGIVPNNRKDLEALSGVGRKTASVVLANAFNIPAFAVDTHIKRVTQKFHLVSQSDDVLKIEKEMTDKLPPEMWFQAHHSILLFGRYQCIARPHNHDECIRLIEEEIAKMDDDSIQS